MSEILGVSWQPCPGGVRVLRLWGDTPCPTVPAQVAGLPTAELGPYCFAEKPPAGLETAQWYCAAGLGPDALPHAAAGRFVEAVALPDTLVTAHSAAFYDCRRLAALTLGSRLEGLGSDLFTNCGALRAITVRAAPDAATGLKKLLGYLSADVTVDFCPAGAEAPAARLFYPEYTEFLDENAPAHIFNHSIEGEGYRLRQCFGAGVLRFSEYDAAFAQACIGEPAAKLARLALYRLMFPFALAKGARQQYRAWLQSHGTAAAALAVAERDAALLRFLCGGLLAPADTAQAARLAAAAGWSEGAALALAGRRRKKSYDFD